MRPPTGRAPHDLRLPVLAGVAWAGALAGPVAFSSASASARVAAGCAVLALAGVLGVLVARDRGRATAAAALMVLIGATAVATFRVAEVHTNPVAGLAAKEAIVTIEGTVVSDARPLQGPYGLRQLVRLRVSEITGRGATYRVRTPVLVFGDAGWARVGLGTEVRARGQLSASDQDATSAEAAALFIAEDPTEIHGAGLWWRAAGGLRDSIRASVAHRPSDEAALVPALVDGDVGGIQQSLSDDFKTTGLSHLLAVSGTNLTLVVGFLLVVARWCGVRGRGLHLVGALGIAGFVLLARTDPSVLRAAAMGAVSLLGLGHNGRQRGLRGLGAAVLGLLLIDPALATSVGFALSVAATLGILLLGPAWRDALRRWLPRWLAEAIAVPAAAQLACTPLIALISSQVSLVAVIANLLAEPAVAPATVLGLVAGLFGLVWAPLGRLVGTLASWCVGWIIAVAHRCADLPMPGLGWGSGPFALGLLTVLVLLIGIGAPRLLRHRVAGVAVAVAMVLGVAVRPPGLGTASGPWVMAMCDVGQGDGLVLKAGSHSAVVVDAGPDPGLMDRCLDHLGIRSVPLLLFTHFDADHVTGAGAVVEGRRVGEIWTTALHQPPHGVEIVDDAAQEAGLEPEVAPYAATRTVGSVTLQVLWPPPTGAADPSQGTETNAASVVLLVRSHGIRLLLTGDLEPESQAAIARALPDLHVDVLKVPHHGSRYQDMDWLLSLEPKIALISVGKDNDYGHPSDDTVAPLEQAGIDVHRTDQEGTIEVVATPDGPRARDG